MIFDGEFKYRFAGRYFGKYRALVSDTQDPSQIGRLMVKVPVVMGTDEPLGWALPSPASGGGVNTGDFNSPEIGDYVWVEFEEGDPVKPIWSPGPWAVLADGSMIPKHSRGLPDNTDYAIREEGNAPPSQFSGSYGNVRSINSKDGSFLEFDATSGSERVQLSHYTGTRIEMTSDGSLQEIVGANFTQRINGTYSAEIVGDDIRNVGGGAVRNVTGKTLETYAGPVTQQFGEVAQEGVNYVSSWQGAWLTAVGGDWTMRAGSNASLTMGGQLAFMIGKNLQMTVMESAEISVSNSLGVPTADALLLHGYNGNTVLRATDATGELITAEIILKGSTPTSNILIGGTLAAEPMVCGTQWNAFTDALITGLITHTHPTGVGPSGVATEGPVLEPALKALVQSALSKVIMGKVT